MANDVSLAMKKNFDAWTQTTPTSSVSTQTGDDEIQDVDNEVTSGAGPKKRRRLPATITCAVMSDAPIEPSGVATLVGDGWVSRGSLVSRGSVSRARGSRGSRSSNWIIFK